MVFKSEEKLSFKKLLQELLKIHSPSGKERAMTGQLADWIKPYCNELYEDNFGNLIAHMGGKGPKFLIASHTDELGFRVRSISEDGFLFVAKTGGMPDKLIEARQVMVNGTIPGIVGTKSAHLQTLEERLSAMPANELFIDIGASSRAEVEALGIRIGSYASCRYNYMEMHDPDLVCCKSLDNRAGCATLFELMRRLDRKNLCCDLYFAFTSQEESGLKGAAAAVNNLQPEYAIAVDTIACADTPGTNWKRDLPVCIGKGVVCSLSEGLKDMNFMHPDLEKLIFDAASGFNIPLQPLSACGLSIGSDASSMSYSGKGVKAGTLALARRYSHSPVELMNINDALYMVELLYHIVCSDIYELS